MVDLLSKSHAITVISNIWLDAGFSIEQGRLGLQAENEFNTNIETELAALYVFVDEYLVLLRYVSFYFLSGMAGAISEDDKDSVAKAKLFYQLSIKQLQTTTSIRLLCSNGLDGNARSQLRLLYEYSLLWIRLLYDIEVTREYQAASTPELSNKFWHKYISRGKNESWVEEYLNKEKIFCLRPHEKTLEEFKYIISTTSHPSFIQGNIDSQFDFDDLDNIFLSTPTPASHFTLSYTLLICATPFSLKPFPDYQLKTLDLRDGMFYPEYKEKIEWDTYNARLHEMFSRLYILATIFVGKLAEKSKQKK